MAKNRRFLLVLCSFFLVLAAACSSADDERQETVEAMGQAIVMTATARAEDELSPEDELATAEAEATESAATLRAESTASAMTAEAASADATATRQALEEAAAEATVMMATAMAAPPPTPEEGPGSDPALLEPIQTELAGYGLDPAEGQLAWMHPPVTLDIEGFQQFAVTNTVGLEPVGNFVLAADITWETEFGDAGCGFLLRSTGLTPDSSQHLVNITRRDGGFAVFQTRINGQFVDSELVTLPIANVDPFFQWPNSSTNRLAVVVQDDIFTIFLNGTLLGRAATQAELGPGLAAYVALTDSGRTVCTFADSWLWQLP